MKLEQFPTNETAQQMMQTITGNGFYDRSYIGKWLFQVMGMELEEAKQYITELADQAFPQSVTWGIGYQEKKYGIPENPEKNLEERRKQILLQKTFHSPMNPAFLERQAGLIVGHDRIKVIENVAPYVFRVEIQEMDDSTAIYEDVRRYVKKVKPSHLSMLIMGKYQSEFNVDITYENRLCIISEFYPRLNVEWLLLDGHWRLDGKYLLNFYKSDTYIDFYPVILKIWSDVVVRHAIETRCKMLIEFKIKVLEKLQLLEIRTSKAVAVRYSSLSEIQSECLCEVKAVSHLRIEVDLWHLDGSVCLDGTRGLKAQVIELEHDEL